MKASIKKVTELVVKCEDKPGELARVLGVISAAGMNILAYCGYVMDHGCQIHVVPEDADIGKKLLRKAGFEVHSADAARITQKNHIGSAAEIARRLGAADVNLNYSYATATEDGPYATIVSSSDIDAAIEALGG